MHSKENAFNGFFFFFNGVCVYFPGGKAFGLLKVQQREKLEEVNRVKRLILHTVSTRRLPRRCLTEGKTLASSANWTWL